MDVTNTNSKIVEIFLDFIRNDIGINENRLKLQLQIHENDNKRLLEEYWSRITNIPLKRFQKTIVRPVDNKPKKAWVPVR